MKTAYPTDYPFNIDEEGWPEKVLDPAYPHQYYYDNGKDPGRLNPYKNHNIEPVSTTTSNQHRNFDSSTNDAPQLAIRRLAADNTDPSLQFVTLRTTTPTVSNTRVSFKSTSPESIALTPVKSPSPEPTQRFPTTSVPSSPNAYLSSRRDTARSNKPSALVKSRPIKPLDPDERPIRPMKDTSVYHSPSSSTSSKRYTPRKTPSRLPKLTTAPSILEPESFQLPSTRHIVNTVTPRRPIRSNLTSKTPVNVSPRLNRLRPIIIEEYAYDNNNNNNNDLYDDESLGSTSSSTTVAYEEVTGMTTREMENYLMSKNSRNLDGSVPPIRTRVYRP